MNCEIREANVSDYENINPIYTEVYNLHVQGRPYKFNSTNITLDFNYFNTLVEDENSKVYIIKYDGRVVAFSFLRKLQTEQRETNAKNESVFKSDFGVAEA